jgi:hypothetical protein
MMQRFTEPTNLATADFKTGQSYSKPASTAPAATWPA